MPFTVLWVPSAATQLIALREDESSREVVIRAAREIERQLQTDPLGAGESRGRNRRILFTAPLVVVFRVMLRERVVDVLEVRRYPRSA